MLNTVTIDDTGMEYYNGPTIATTIKTEYNCDPNVDCELSKINEFNTNIPTSEMPDKFVDLTYEPITLKVDAPQNGNLTPGLYRVIIRKWFDRYDNTCEGCWSDGHPNRWIIKWDRTIIIYKLPSSPPPTPGNECTQDSDCGASFCSEHNIKTTPTCTNGSCDPNNYRDYTCPDSSPNCIETTNGARCQ